MDLNPYIPDVSIIVTEEYIDGLIITKKWVEHGSSIYDFIGDIIDIENFLPYSLQTTPMEEIPNHKDFRVFLKEWLPKRYSYVTNEIKEELKDCDQLILHRCLYLSPADQSRILSGENFFIGKYWGTGHVEAWGIVPEKEKLETHITAIVNPQDVDWIETLKSRMDYMNGDQEQEIQLKNNIIPKFLSLHCRTRKLKREL